MAKPVPRTKKLVAILEEAGKLSMEMQAEPSIFIFKNIPSGTKGPFEIGGFPMIKDVRGLVSKQQLASSEHSFTVTLTVSPAVVRVSHLNNEEILVEQARVLLDATVE